MGREIRRVPPNWEHPKDEKGNFIPMIDKDYDSEAEEWIRNFDLHRQGKHPSEWAQKYKYFWEYDSPPDEDVCRPKFEVEPTWYQVYETVSEGTPVTPPFETLDEIVEYLVKYGDYYYQHPGRYPIEPWDREAAESFCKDMYAPTLFFTPKTGLVSPRNKEFWTIGGSKCQ